MRPKRYDFRVQIDGQEVEYEVMADSQSSAEAALLSIIRNRELSAGQGIIWILVAGVLLAVVWIARNVRIARPPVLAPARPKGASVDILQDGPDLSRRAPAWRDVAVGSTRGRLAGPIEDFDRAWKIAVYTDRNEDELAPLLYFVRAYLPATDDAPERGAVMLFKFPLASFPVEFGNGGAIDAIYGGGPGKYDGAEVKADTVATLISGIARNLQNVGA